MSDIFTVDWLRQFNPVEVGCYLASLDVDHPQWESLFDELFDNDLETGWSIKQDQPVFFGALVYVTHRAVMSVYYGDRYGKTPNSKLAAGFLGTLREGDWEVTYPVDLNSTIRWSDDCVLREVKRARYVLDTHS